MPMFKNGVRDETESHVVAYTVKQKKIEIAKSVKNSFTTQRVYPLSTLRNS